MRTVLAFILLAMGWAQIVLAEPVNFKSSTAMVAMRDGTRLYTEVYVPEGRSSRLPILLMRTPYGATAFARPPRELAEDGYIFVFQDIRGRHKSEGQFAMLRPARNRADPKAIDESTDAFDTIDWLLKNVEGHNGRVGMYGVSYAAWLAQIAGIDPHPALKAISPQASPADMFIGDDFFHNGAFRLSYGFEYVALMERGKENNPYQFDRYDSYEWFRELGPIGNVAAKIPVKGTFWQAFSEHPNYDRFWKRIAVPPQLGTIRVPTLTVGGWYDQEDGYGPLKLYQALRRGDRHRRNYLVVGPWNHGGWRESGRALGAIDFGSATGDTFRKRILAPWFARYLKDRRGPPIPRVHLFQTGSNQWHTMDEWRTEAPASRRRLYLAAGGRLSFDAPQDSGPAADSYVSDPQKPVPYQARPIRPIYSPSLPNTTDWKDWLVADQRFADGRPDVLTYVSEPLTSDLVVSGEIVAHLWAATTGSDSDWVVKLIDVLPDDHPTAGMGGYQLMVTGEVLRARFRKSLSFPEPVTPGALTPYAVSLHERDHRFRKGHRIMVQIQSSWFPLIDRNPQQFVTNIFRARESDFRTAVQSIHRSKLHPSYIDLPLGDAIEQGQSSLD